MHPSYNPGMGPAAGGQGMDYSNQQQQEGRPAGAMGGPGMGGAGPAGFYQGGSQHGGFPGMSHGGTMQQVAQQNYSQQMMMQQQQQQPFSGQPGMPSARAGYNPAAFAAANPPPSNIGIAPNMLSQAQPALTLTIKQEPKRQLMPPGFPPEVLADLSRMSVGMLCTVGKDLVHELNLRTSTLCGMLKAQSERKQIQPSQDPHLIIEYCIKLFDKLAEIRVLIDKRSTGNEKSLRDIFDDLTDMSDPVDEKPAELQALYDIFNENKRKLTNLNGDLKLLDWMATVSDPGQLKRVDKMATSYPKENIH